VSDSGISSVICKSAPCPRQITTPAPHQSIFYRPDALSAAQPTASHSWTDWHKIWRGWLHRPYHPTCQNSGQSPKWRRPGACMKCQCRMVFSFRFLVTHNFAHIQRLNHRTGFYVGCFMQCQFRVIASLEGGGVKMPKVSIIPKFHFQNTQKERQ